jgi:pyruvate/2-oxoglutarate dehydrogenase complex dihydrolipoamide acyltransferase (E2) component
VGGIGQKRESVDAQTVARELLSLTVSFDHNLIDGAPAARFTTRLKELIESAHGLADQEAPRPAATTGASTREGVAVALG